MAEGKRRAARQVRRAAPQRRRAAARKAQRPAAQRVRAATRKPGKVEAAPGHASPPPADWAIQVFDEQIDPLWNRLTQECQEFVDGYNVEMGVPQLQVDTTPDLILVKFAATGAEVYMQLDKTRRVIECIMSSRCADYGSCLVEQSAVGVMIQDGQLRFVAGSSPLSEEDLAVKLLTGLIEAEVATS